MQYSGYGRTGRRAPNIAWYILPLFVVASIAGSYLDDMGRYRATRDVVRHLKAERGIAFSVPGSKEKPRLFYFGDFTGGDGDWDALARIPDLGSVDIADWDGDGRKDLVARFSDGSTFVNFRKAGGSASIPPASPLYEGACGETPCDCASYIAECLDAGPIVWGSGDYNHDGSRDFYVSRPDRGFLFMDMGSDGRRELIVWDPNGISVHPPSAGGKGFSPYPDTFAGGDGSLARIVGELKRETSEVMNGTSPHGFAIQPNE